MNIIVILMIALPPEVIAFVLHELIEFVTNHDWRKDG